MTRRKRTNSLFFPVLKLALAILPLAAVTCLQAQEIPRIQVFAGYSRLQYDSKVLGFSDNTGLNGGTASAAFNLTQELGVVGELATQTGPNFRVRNWAIGPQFMYGKWGALFFGHVLFGKMQTRVTTNSTETQSNNATAFGGGVDFPVGGHFSVRIIQADYFRTKAFGADQGNTRFATGVVFRWGEVKKRRKSL